jgi:hypothetical protein
MQEQLLMQFVEYIYSHSNPVFPQLRKRVNPSG